MPEQAWTAAVPELVDGRKVRDQRQMHYEMLPHARPGGIAGLLEIVLDLQEAFDITIEDSELQTLRTMADVNALFMAKAQSQVASH